MSERQKPALQKASSAEAAPPCGVVIFGASGDLTQRLLMPALFNMRRSGILPQKFALIGAGRQAMDDNTFRIKMLDGIRQHAADGGDAEARDRFVQGFRYVAGQLDGPDLYAKLTAAMAEADERLGLPGNWLFYLATPPELFGPVVQQLAASGLTKEGDQGWRRVIIEKPFGRDLPSAQALNAELGGVLRERQIFRIDHYLGKETVQNIMVLRFANGLFEPLWNRDHIDHIQITVAETVGVEKRAGYYDRSGALRDMIPNHLLQLLSLVAMEPPTAFAAEAVRGEKVKVLNAVQDIRPRHLAGQVVRGQYAAGKVGDKSYRAYLEEEGVAAGSPTETYVAMKLKIDNWRWAGMPFYLRTGKALARRRTEIAIQFRQAPYALFRGTPVEALTPNVMVLAIQPDEGVSLSFTTKVPGPTVRMGGAEMNFSYSDAFDAPRATGYETLLYDCMNGDATLFQRADYVEAGWRIVTPIQEHWAECPADDLDKYAAGGNGPGAADELLSRDGRLWRELA